MRISTPRSWTMGGIALCCSVACGPSAPPPPPPVEDTSGDEAPPPPPPPAPASLYVVHASPDPGLSTLSITLDGQAPIVSALAAGSASAPMEIASGTHALNVLGVASVETGEAPVVLTTSIELSPGSRPILLVYGEPAVVPPLAVTVLDEDASGTSTRGRVVHGLVGVAGIDVCVAGVPIANALDAGGISQSTPLNDGALTLELHAVNDTACHGRAIGTAHVTLTAGTSHVIALSGHSGRRGRITGSVIVCTEGASVGCTSVPIAAR